MNAAAFGQFGQNKVQYKDHIWYYIQTKHFDIYFSQEGSPITEFAAAAAEEALTAIQNKLNYAINNRISFIIYNSQAEFQETNVTDEYLSEGIGGFTEMFKNRVVLPFTGNYKMFRHVIHHELVHAVINDMFYGGSIQNIISNNVQIQIPLWFNEGLAEYLSLGWDSNTDMYIRDAIGNDNLPDIQQLDGYAAYRGGQSVFYYISQKYGDEKIGELVNKMKSKGNFETGLDAALGLKLDELNERWKKFLKKRFWPDVSFYQDPDEFAKRLTNHKKDGGFYNTSPAISPKGDKVAFISNRDVFFDVYIMSAQDGKIIKRIIKGNRSADFEELNILTPGLSWSPDGTKIALGAKSNGEEVIYIIDVESEDIDVLPYTFYGMGTVHWSPDGKKLAFAGQSAVQSDIFIYDFETKKIKNLTEDVFSDSDPSWSPDSKTIYFISDRGENLVTQDKIFKMTKHDYHQNDIYAINLETSAISRITSTLNNDESSPVCSPDGKELLFISDKNGINNIYKIALNGSVYNDSSANYTPITNSLNGIYQLSTSVDGKKIVFTSMYQSAYDVFLMTNPFEMKLQQTTLKPTLFTNELLQPVKKKETFPQADTTAKSDTVKSTDSPFFTGQYVDSTKAANDKAKIDIDNYVFGESNYFKNTVSKDTTKFAPVNNLDSAGNYRVNKYKVTFSTDIVYANAGFTTLYGLEGTTVLSFSDILGNHRLVAQTSLQIDLKNSDYGLAYFYLPGRLNFGIEGFHTANFLYIDRATTTDLFRFENYGGTLSFSYPFNRFYRADFGLSFINVAADNLDNPDDSFGKATYLIPSAAFVHDNTIFGYTSPIEGTRYRFDILANPLHSSKDPYHDQTFFSVLGDYRTYLRFWYDYSFAIRFSGGYSGGSVINRQKFFIGGVENWINRRFATVDVPVTSTSNFAFMTAVLPLRGYDYAEQSGSMYGLTNLEFRFPLIRYLLSGLPLQFRNILGVAFIDAGSAWGYSLTNNYRSLQLFQKDPDKGLLTKDLLVGTGVGARMYFLYFLCRFDVAWRYDFNKFSMPVYYFSLGTDF
jgi:Tol biopolymer transport system component